MALRDIALSLGLSVTTVSRALADYSDVADETRRRVRAEAERIGYVPNAMARRLRKGRADAIGVAAPCGAGALEDTFLSTALVGVWSRLAEFEQDLMLLPSADGANDCTDRDGLAFRRAVTERRVDGMILVRPRRDDPRIATLRAARMPFVLLDGTAGGDDDTVAIGSDEAWAARLVCERLAMLGHAGVTCVGPEENFDFALARFEQFEAAAAEAGLRFDRATAPLSATGGREATERLLDGPGPMPTAIVFLTNRMAIGGMAALARSRHEIGRDVSAITFGDSHTLRHAVPEITVVRPQTHDMARHAVDALLALRDGRPFDLVRRWTPTLDLRQSDRRTSREA